MSGKLKHLPDSAGIISGSAVPAQAPGGMNHSDNHHNGENHE